MGENIRDAGQQIEVPIAWEALEDAFENNAPEIHSYLHFDTGEVIRIVDGVADPAMHGRITADSRYIRVDPVSSREQYRWMERFIATVEESELRHALTTAIDGKGAFRRFKDALMNRTVDRERWFAFRTERLRACIEAWLVAHGINPVERPKWKVPTATDVDGQINPDDARAASRLAHATEVDSQRSKLVELATGLPARDLDLAVAFLEFIRDRRHLPRTRSKSPSQSMMVVAADGEGHEP